MKIPFTCVVAALNKPLAFQLRVIPPANGTSCQEREKGVMMLSLNGDCQMAKAHLAPPSTPTSGVAISVLPLVSFSSENPFYLCGGCFEQTFGVSAESHSSSKWDILSGTGKRSDIYIYIYHFRNLCASLGIVASGRNVLMLMSSLIYQKERAPKRARFLLLTSIQRGSKTGTFFFVVDVYPNARRKAS